MTQPANPPNADTILAQPEDKAPKTYSSMDEIFAEVLERSGLGSFGDVVRTKRCICVMPDGAVATIDLGQDSPFDSKSMVVGIFHDDDEVRIYTFPKGKGEIKRYVLAKNVRFLAVDSMVDVEQFIDELADEYEMLATGIEPEPDDPETTSPNGSAGPSVSG